MGGLIDMAMPVKSKDEEFRRFESPYLQMQQRLGNIEEDEATLERRKKLAKSKLGKDFTVFE